MTKERRLAIQMWEQIVTGIKNGTLRVGPAIDRFKTRFCDEHKLDWKIDCWFCQYIRKDFRSNLPSRKNVKVWTNGCRECPLYKYLEAQQTLGYNECGCQAAINTSLYARVLYQLDVEAAELIVKALKGEEIWK
jgi:hypothetical protein